MKTQRLLFHDKARNGYRHSEQREESVESSRMNNRLFGQSTQSDDDHDPWDDWDYQGKRPDQVQASVEAVSWCIASFLAWAFIVALIYLLITT